MLIDTAIDRVYLACGSTDLRKNIDGLAVLVKEGFDLDPFSACLFVFCNRGRDKLKILQWQHNGFWLHYRRLERERFQWPSENKVPMSISFRELRWLLDGLTLAQRGAHKEVTERTLLWKKPYRIRVHKQFIHVTFLRIRYNFRMETTSNATPESMEELNNKCMELARASQKWVCKSYYIL